MILRRLILEVVTVASPITCTDCHKSEATAYRASRRGE